MEAAKDNEEQRAALASTGGAALQNDGGWPFSPLNATTAGGRTALQRTPSEEREPFAFMTVRAPAFYSRQS